MLGTLAPDARYDFAATTNSHSTNEGKKTTDVLCEGGVDDGVEEGDEDEDEGGVDQLHLVRLDDVPAELAVHAGGLEGPARALMRKTKSD